MPANSPIIDYRTPATSRDEAGGKQLDISLIGMLATLAVLVGTLCNLHVTMRHPEVIQLRAKADLSRISTQLEAFNIDNDRFPTSSEGLQALAQNPGNLPSWKGYVEAIPNDPWGKSYIYKCPGANGRSFDLISTGPDRQVGTADDIVLPGP